MEGKLFDLSYLVEQLESPGLVRDIVCKYMHHLNAQIERLECIYTNPEQSDEIHRIAHSIRSGSCNIGSDRIQALAKELETAARGKLHGEYGIYVEKLKEAFHLLSESITFNCQEKDSGQESSLCRG